MKEQITAKEFLNKHCEKEIETLKSQSEVIYNAIIIFMEQYAQAKVLEALEREVMKAIFKTDKSGFKNLSMNEAKEYYETEVKPRYERTNTDNGKKYNR